MELLGYAHCLLYVFLFCAFVRSIFLGKCYRQYSKNYTLTPDERFKARTYIWLGRVQVVMIFLIGLIYVIKYHQP